MKKLTAENSMISEVIFRELVLFTCPNSEGQIVNDDSKEPTVKRALSGTRSDFLEKRAGR